MELNNLRVESHVAQKNRRRKLRFQQNSGDLNNQHPPHDHPQFEPRDIHRPFPYNTNVFPSEMFNSVARNPHLLLPSGHGFVSHDQDSSPGSSSALGLGTSERMLISSSGGGFVNLANPQNCNDWKTVVPSQQVGSDHWNVVSYSNASSTSIDQRNMNSGCYGYQQDVHNSPAFGSSPFYQNTVQQDQVTLAQLPQSKNDSVMTQSIPCWMNNSDESGLLANRVHDHGEQTTMAANEGNCNTQALSLSLSSVPQLKDHQLTLQSGQKPLKPDLLPNSDPKSFMGVSSIAQRNTGPLGPFTGYATVLKNSKYLKPAQELLNGSCDVGGQELVQACHDVYSQKILEEEMSRAFSSLDASYGGSEEHISSRSNSGPESLRPEFHRKKARLLYMQEEVCRRYKQYLQQMQTVISAFETVAGLSTSTPYVCLALKAVSRHFHCVKNVISDQLSQMRKMVGEGLCSSNTMSGNATSTSRLKSIDQRLEKSGGGSAGFFASQQPVWRPQRGLPERAISVLKTWLFDHFLHPYPSDADKHMLATQTGLTRNQVSNWFINARVRIWKPMVEEIHTLETKGLTETNSTNPQPDGQESNRMDTGSLTNSQPEYSRNNEIVTVNEPNDHQLQDHEKQARPEYQMPLTNMDRLMSVMPYQRATFDASGLGPVSLTLGLRQNAEHVQQLQQHFGGQLIHDFVG
ncbi:hypothetical protein L2E82_33067 [Cichorium intybus]|uniref:Uncharacterized protein n=1 Tax=Cichorium intybus TaxID=13427 RepID=A0ACB9BJ66_CICIN|nr:hypothetical protein L2E82_33067 [Cichorium intybus]